MRMLATMLRRDREGRGFTPGQVAYRIGVTTTVYRCLEAGECDPDFSAYDAICKLFGWPQAFVATTTSRQTYSPPRA